jgi:TRAP-type uncharacterized transport system fused permease subunit
MDKDDQDALVESMEDEAWQQTKQFQRFFGFVGGFAVLVSLAYPLLCQEECSVRWTTCWIHSIVSSVNHVCAILLSRRNQRSQDFQLLVATIFLVAAPSALWVFGNFAEDVEHFHVGLLVGNLVTFLGALLLRWDIESTSKALDDLNGAKYEHKSL